MNTTFLDRVPALLGFATLTIICGGLSAQAETTNAIVAGSSATPLTSQTTEFTAQTDPDSANVLAQIASAATKSSKVVPESTTQVLDAQPTNLEPSAISDGDDNPAVPDSTSADSTSTQQSQVATTDSSDNTAETALALEATGQASASDLIAEPSASQTSRETSNAAPTVAQVPEVIPGGTTRSSSSYFGIGGNFGIIGDTAIGNQSLAIFSKIGLASFLSVRPSALIDFDNAATFLIPVTFDLPRLPILGTSFGPYLGGGLAASTDEGLGGLVSAGIDAPVTSQLTVTAGLNLGFIDGVDLGVQVGIGYNFFGF